MNMSFSYRTSTVACRSLALAETLKEISRRKPTPQNRVPREVEQAVIVFAVEQPANDQVCVSTGMRSGNQ